MESGSQPAARHGQHRQSRRPDGRRRPARVSVEFAQHRRHLRNRVSVKKTAK